VLQSSESGLALQHAMKRRPRVTPRPRRRERGKSVEAEAGDEEGVGGEAEDGAVVVHLSLHPDEEGDDNNKDDAGEAIAQGEDDEGDEVGAKGGVAGGDAPKRGSSDALRQQVIDYKSTQERHESALEQIMKTLQEVEKGIVRKHPRDIERLKKSAETKKKFIKALSTKITQLEDKIKNKLVKEKEKRELQKETVNMTWTSKDVNVLIDLRYDPNTDARFKNHIDTSQNIWNDITASFNRGRDPAHHRSATSLIEKHRQVMTQFHLYCERRKKSQASGAAGDLPTQNCIQYWVQDWTPKLLQLELHKQPDVVAPHEISQETLLSGGISNPWLQPSPSPSVSSLQSPQSAVSSSSSTPAGSQPSALAAQSAQTVNNTSRRIQGQFAATHNRGAEKKRRLEEQRSNQVTSALESLVMKMAEQRRKDDEMRELKRSQERAQQKLLEEQKRAEERRREEERQERDRKRDEMMIASSQALTAVLRALTGDRGREVAP